jgi:hypothetical protein
MESALDVLARVIFTTESHDPDDSEGPRLLADAQLAAIAAAGYAVVPVEPTKEMEIAGAIAHDFDAVKMPSRVRAALTYRAMLAAAPKPGDAP